MLEIRFCVQGVILMVRIIVHTQIHLGAFIALNHKGKMWKKEMDHLRKAISQY